MHNLVLLPYLMVLIFGFTTSQECNITGDFTANSTYGRNLNLILSSLASNVTAKGGFYNATVGEDSDRVYVLALCRQGYDIGTCFSCVNTSAHGLITRCPVEKEAFSWTGQGDVPCLVRYSDRNIFGLLQLSPKEQLYNTGSITTNQTKFDQIWESLMEYIVRNASTGSLYSTGKTELTYFQTIYAMMQCSPDMSQSDCDKCLRDSVGSYISCCHGKQGGVVRTPSCYFRWDFYPFHDASFDTISLTSPPPTSHTCNIKGADSTYGRNLNLILSSLASNVQAKSGFYNATVGEDPNRVYALAFCRQGYDAGSCFSCVNNAAHGLITKCPIKKDAFSWTGDVPCLVRYSHSNIFGQLQQSPKDTIVKNETGKFTKYENFLQIWDSLTFPIMNSTSTGSSMFKYATGKANLSSVQTIYAMMQCSPDLSQEDCYKCLKDAVGSYDYQGGVVGTPSCFFRWDLYPFYDASVDTIPLTSPSPQKSTNMTITDDNGGISSQTIVIIIVPTIIFMALVALTCALLKKRKPIKIAKKVIETSQEIQLLALEGVGITGYSNENLLEEKQMKSQELPLVRLALIQEATKCFSDENKLGEGGFGPVYKGKLADGNEIAVKRLSKTSGQGLQEFKTEITLISKLQHKNLVRLMGCCLEGKEVLLIYEYMPNKSLDFFLFDSTRAEQLDWKRRLAIINGIARGILYLHEDSRLKIVHRDLKTSNVLLDNYMNPKISDFGMARIFGGNQDEANTNRVVGTYGYMAPEYAMEGLFSVKSDVFSFGVILLEIISGKKNNKFHLSKNGESLLTFAWKLWSKSQGMELMDPLLAQSCMAAEVLKCIHIGLLCVQEDPADRPTMSSLVLMLGSETITFPMPTEPAFSVGRVVPVLVQSTSSSVNEVTLSNLAPR